MVPVRLVFSLSFSVTVISPYQHKIRRDLVYNSVDLYQSVAQHLGGGVWV